MKRFLVKSTAKIIVAVTFIVIAFTLVQAPVLTNEIALTQMEPSDGVYIVWSSYTPVVSLIKSVLCGVGGYLLGRSILDIYKFIKQKEKSL